MIFNSKPDLQEHTLREMYKQLQYVFQEFSERLKVLELHLMDIKNETFQTIPSNETEKAKITNCATCKFCEKYDESLRKERSLSSHYCAYKQQYCPLEADIRVVSIKNPENEICKNYQSQN